MLEVPELPVSPVLAGSDVVVGTGAGSAPPALFRARMPNNRPMAVNNATTPIKSHPVAPWIPNKLKGPPLRCAVLSAPADLPVPTDAAVTPEVAVIPDAVVLPEVADVPPTEAEGVAVAPRKGVWPAANPVVWVLPVV